MIIPPGLVRRGVGVLITKRIICALFLLMVKALARDSGRNCLYFYPQKYPDETERCGLCDKDATMRHGKRWVVEGMEGVPYIKPWKTVLTKRALAL